MNSSSKKITILMMIYTVLYSPLFVHELEAVDEVYYSQVGQDEFILKNIFPDKIDGVIIDIGANDGVKFSNSLKFEQRGWQCICIEPLPRAFNELIKNRSCVCIQGCISDKEGTDQFLQINGACEMLSGLTLKYDPRHVSRIAYEVDQNRDSYEVIPVMCYKLNSILDAYDIKHVDILSLDTEGGELDILKSIDNIEQIVDVICVEDNYNDPKLVEILTEKGFVLIASLHQDLIFRNKRFCVNEEA